MCVGWFQTRNDQVHQRRTFPWLCAEGIFGRSRGAGAWTRRATVSFKHMQTPTMCSLQKWVTGGYRVYLGCEMTKNIRPEVCSEPLNLVKFFHLVVRKVFLKWLHIVCVFFGERKIHLPEELDNEFATVSLHRMSLWLNVGTFQVDADHSWKKWSCWSPSPP